MAEIIKILTKDGREKDVRGYRRALSTKLKIRKSFDRKAKQNPDKSFGRVCALVGEAFQMSSAQVYSIMRNTFEYTPDNFRA